MKVRRGVIPRKSGQTNYQQVSVHLDPDLLSELDRIALEQGYPTRSAVIRHLCHIGVQNRRVRAVEASNEG
jgi:metal-responsive CopG/Arc/MetJ family transcriptional regulator